MTITIRTDHRIMRRSTRHLILANGDQLLYAATTFAEAIDYLRAKEIQTVVLCAGDHRLLIDVSPSNVMVRDPRQQEMPWWNHPPPQPSPQVDLDLKYPILPPAPGKTSH